MSIKTLANRATNKVGQQLLTVKHHSPVLMLGAGIVGVGVFGVMACRATLKVNDLLDEGTERLDRVSQVDADEKITEEEIVKAKFGVKLQTAIKIAKLYAPAVLVGVGSVALITGSHVVLKKRNVGLTAAYAIVSKSFDEYRGRVIEDQGAEKDFEYRFGTEDREIVEEGEHGPETRIIKGPNQAAVKANAGQTYARVFDEYNENWSDVPLQNPTFVQGMQNFANDLLRVKGWVTLNDVYDLLGFEKTQAGQQVGWVSKPGKDENGNPKGDGFIDFGVWNHGTYHGKEWIGGNYESILLDFNVDGVILGNLKEV
jgi:hypothetical protein